MAYEPDEQPDEVDGRRLTPGGARRRPRRWHGGRGRGARPAPAAPGGIADGHGTTVARTLLKGEKGKDGYRKIVVGPGEPHLVRDELMKHVRRPGPAQPARHRRAWASSPTCTCWTRSRRPGWSSSTASTTRARRTPPLLPFQGAYRAQDMLTTARRRGDRPGAAQGRARPGDRAAAVVHGHHRRQRRQHPVQRAPLADRPAGREADPAGLRRPDQVRRRRRPDRLRRPLLAPRRPARRPARGPADQPVRLPARPGAARRLPAAVRHPRASACRGCSVFGNHDGLVQGNVPSSPLVAQIATGSTKIIDLPPGVNIGELAGQLVTNDPQGLQTLFGGPSRQVTADPNRRPLSRAETIAEYFKYRRHARTGTATRPGTSPPATPTTPSARAGPRHRARHRQPERRLGGLDRPGPARLADRAAARRAAGTTSTSRGTW